MMAAVARSIVEHVPKIKYVQVGLVSTNPQTVHPKLAPLSTFHAAMPKMAAAER